MIYAYITDNTATQVWTGRAKKVHLSVNAALTGTIKVIDNTTGTTANVATITNPTVGLQFDFWGFNAGVLIIASGACDITCSVDNSNIGAN